VLSLIPLAVLMLASISGAWSFPFLAPATYTARAWTSIWSGHDRILNVMLVSAVLSSAVACISTVIGFLAARHVAYHRRRTLLATIAYIPFVVSPVVVGVCILYLWLRIGIAGSVVGVILAQTIFSASFAVIFFLGFWNEEKRALEDLVSTLGGSSLQSLTMAILPISGGAIGVCFFQTFLISWFQYGLTVLIGGGVIQTLPMKVFEFVGEANTTLAAGASLMLILPPLVLLALQRRFVARIG